MFSAIRKDLLLFSVTVLRKLARLYHIRVPRTYSKSDIVEELVRYRAAVTIQRKFRARVSLNDICPFTLEPIRYPFWPTKTNKGFIYCNLRDLGEFFVTTGDFRDPTTRKYYSSHDLDRIEELIRYFRIKLSKTLGSSRRNMDFYRKKKCKDEQIDILLESVRFTTWVIRERIEDVIMAKDSVSSVILHMDNIYFEDISSCLVGLKSRSQRYFDIALNDSEKIINDIPYDCTVVDKIRNHFKAWVIAERIKYK